MIKHRLITALKILVITVLVLVMVILSIMKWKSDVLLDQALRSVQHSLTDSLTYTDASLDWFRHFPSATIQLTGLHLGRRDQPLVSSGDLDMVIRLMPLFRDEIIINRIQITDAHLHLTHRKGRWSYDLLKKAENQSSDESTFNTQIRQLVLKNTMLHYDDGASLQAHLHIKDGTLKGQFKEQLLQSDLKIDGTIQTLKSNTYALADTMAFLLDGQYAFDFKNGLQKFDTWNWRHESISLKGEGTVQRHPDHEAVDMEIAWSGADPQHIRPWLPTAWLSSWQEVTLAGESEGRVTISGVSSKKSTPRIRCTASLKNGVIGFPDDPGAIKGLHLDLLYDTGDPQMKQPSGLTLDFKQKAVFKQSMEGRFTMENLTKPVISAKLKGPVPGRLLHLAGWSFLKVDRGILHVEKFELSPYKLADYNAFHLLQHCVVTLRAEGLSFTYAGNTVAWPKGIIEIDRGLFKVDIESLTWDKATLSDIKGEMEAKADALDFILASTLCGGHLDTRGTLSNLRQNPVWTAQWKVTGIDMKTLLASFSDFGQSFLTSTHLSGKANIWAQSLIPFDTKWNILTRKVSVKSAIDISEGRLQNLKTLEDFSRYIHLEDLRDIRFSHLRNYMKIDDGKVYLPVMFIQSSAINLSISGEHAFDQKILYYLKLNAGQTAAGKLKKSNDRKELRPARKSGWINMYFVLEGTTSAVRYQQYRMAVIAGFEQSVALKEKLRQELVDTFGYDVYWVEPNEWEEIPEY